MQQSLLYPLGPSLISFSFFLFFFLFFWYIQNHTSLPSAPAVTVSPHLGRMLHGGTGQRYMQSFETKHQHSFTRRQEERSVMTCPAATTVRAGYPNLIAGRFATHTSRFDELNEVRLIVILSSSIPILYPVGSADHSCWRCNRTRCLASSP